MLILLIVLLLALTAGADPAGRNVHDMLLACNLIDYGRRERSTESLLASVQILVRLRPVNLAEGSPGLDLQGLLAEAESWAAGDPALSALVARTRLQVEDMRGAMDGPPYYCGTAAPGRPASRIITVRAKEGWELLLNGAYGSQLALQVYDAASGRQLLTDDKRRNFCHLKGQARKMQSLEVRVVNRGTRPATYTLICP